MYIFIYQLSLISFDTSKRRMKRNYCPYTDGGNSTSWKTREMKIKENSTQFSCTANQEEEEEEEEERGE